jgi:copper chaperone
MTTILNIKGMTCGHCVKAVTDALEGVDGVSDAQVELQSGTARVEHDEERAGVPAMQEAVAGEGYTAEPAAR